MEDGVAIFVVVGAVLELGECEMMGVEVVEWVEMEVGAARALSRVLSLYPSPPKFGDDEDLCCQ